MRAITGSAAVKYAIASESSNSRFTSTRYHRPIRL